MKICIIGTGYVGLVSAACFSEMGNDVVCVDNNPALVDKLNGGSIHIFEPGLETLVDHNRKDGRLRFTTSLAEGLDGARAAFICVGTPSRDDGSCDLGYVRAVAGEIGRAMQEPLVIVDKSTVPVGTADMVREIVSKELAARGVDIEFHVASNPEFLKEGDAVNDFMKPDRVIVGTDSAYAAELLKELYSPFARSRDKFISMGVRSAEMTKYAANCMLATKISFINEIANICEQVGADVGDVRTGIGADHRIGYHFIYPGMGYGGSCFPKDVKALIRTAHEHDFVPQLLEAVDDVNNNQKLLMARRIAGYFEPQGGVKGKTLALWGLAFKANTDDLRESAPLAIARELAGQGMNIRIYDPVAAERGRHELAGTPQATLVDSQYAALEGADALLVATEWNQFRTPDFERIKKTLSAPIIFDGRNLYNAATLARLGFAYFSIGRKAITL
ncbi:UDP-glucose/GDP-mannose dehydrogenase family protein [Desulfovibrio sp. OttesenSCG-928-C06]|nr:UDP-glucose/GDP-mannose dehydrogenase family protein [Desulfovibrio sp. OttesenSCG-928-C06]